MNRLFRWLTILPLCLVGAVAGLYAADFVVRNDDPIYPQDRTLNAGARALDPAHPGHTLYDFDLYPYTGGHTQAHFHANGGRFVTGPHGFMTSIDIDAPPPKPPNTLRLIMTGGSAAAGHGASDNAHMIHEVIERLFKTRAPCGPGIGLQVTNLAMGGSISYQNYVTLNLWGHPLDPDMILSLSGTNDLIRGLHLTQNGQVRPDQIRFPKYNTFHYYVGYPAVAGGILIQSAAGDTGFLAFLDRQFPHLMRNTPLGMALRAFSIRRREAAFMENFEARFPKVEYQQGAANWFTHALLSIHRDFPNVAMAVAYQPFLATPDNLSVFLRRSGLDVRDYLARYATFIRNTEAPLARNGIQIIDTHDWYQRHHAGTLDPGDGTHMSDDKQAYLAAYLLDQLTAPLCEIANSRLTGTRTVPRPPPPQ